MFKMSYKLIIYLVNLGNLKELKEGSKLLKS